MQNFIIREVEESELENCAEIIRKSFATVAAEFNLTQENCPTNGAFLTFDRLLSERQSGKLQYGLLINDNLAGFVCLNKTKENHIYSLEKLAVLPEFRHNGGGLALLNFAEEKVKSFGGEKITIGIIEENIILKEWYLRNGFIHTGATVIPSLPFTVGFMEVIIL